MEQAVTVDVVMTESTPDTKNEQPAVLLPHQRPVGPIYKMPSEIVIDIIFPMLDDVDALSFGLATKSLYLITKAIRPEVTKISSNQASIKVVGNFLGNKYRHPYSSKVHYNPFPKNPNYPEGHFDRSIFLNKEIYGDIKGDWYEAEAHRMERVYYYIHLDDLVKKLKITVEVPTPCNQGQEWFKVIKAFFDTQGWTNVVPVAGVNKEGFTTWAEMYSHIMARAANDDGSCFRFMDYRNDGSYIKGRKSIEDWTDKYTEDRDLFKGGSFTPIPNGSGLNGPRRRGLRRYIPFAARSGV